MKTKEIKIQIPKWYEIDKENSTFECVKFKPIINDITYKDICNKLFEKGYYYFGDYGNIREIVKYSYKTCVDKNNSACIKQLDKILALNQLLNIAEYYNRLHTKNNNHYVIVYNKNTQTYTICMEPFLYIHGIEALFNTA